MKLNVRKENILRDWALIDYALFSKRVNAKNGFSEDFVTEWNHLKYRALKRHYTIHEDELPKVYGNPLDEAMGMAQRLRELLVARFKREKGQLQESVSVIRKKLYAHQEQHVARNHATQVILAKEALTTMFGEENHHVYKLTQLIARKLK